MEQKLLEARFHHQNWFVCLQHICLHFCKAFRIESKDCPSDEGGGHGVFCLLSGFSSAIDPDDVIANLSDMTFYDLPSCSTIEKVKSV